MKNYTKILSREFQKYLPIYEEDSHLILIEEYISGRTLEDIIKSHDLTSQYIIQYTEELCNILKELHAFCPPIIHRDIKPSNIIVTSSNHIVLIDFNAAKEYSEIESSDTVLLGTKGYAAPEQYGFWLFIFADRHLCYGNFVKRNGSISCQFHRPV